MNEIIEIKGGAGEFEGAVIAVVLDRIDQEEKVARQARPGADLSPWLRALDPDDDPAPLEVTRLR